WHDGFDEAGAGNRLTVWLLRHSQRKRGATAMLSLRSAAPVLDPTTYTFAQTNLSLSFFACDTVADHTFRVVRQPTGMLVAYRRIIERCSTTRFMQPPWKDTISDSANEETSTQGRSPFRKAGSATASFLTGACRPLRRRCGRGPQ